MQKLTPGKHSKLIVDLERLLPDTAWKKTLINYFERDDTYLPHMVRALQSYSNSKPGTIKQIIKATRTGYTYNSIMAGLCLDKKLLIVEPTNEIGKKTVRGAVDKFIEMTGRTDLMVRPILSNKIVCTELEGHKERKGIHIPLRTPECKECNANVYEQKDGDLMVGDSQYPRYLEPDKGYCIIKTMLKEEKEFRERGEEYAPDVVYTTYSKLENLKNNSTKNKLFRKLIKKRNVVLFDEFGYYLQGGSDAAMIHEIAYRKDTGAIIEDSEYDINMFYKGVMKFIDDNKLKINEGTLNVEGQQASTRAKDRIEKYMKPLLNKYNDIMAIKKDEDRSPFNLTNPLAFFKEVIKMKDGDMRTVGRHEYLRIKLEEEVKAIEGIGINEDGKLFTEEIWTLLNVLQEDDLIVSKEKGTEWPYTYGTVPNEIETSVYAERVSIKPTNRHKLRMLAEYAARHTGQEILVSDATLGRIDLNHLTSRHNLGGVDRKQVVEVWGDPGETNKQQFIFQLKDPDSEHPIFGSTGWDKKEELREEYTKQLRSIASELGAGNLLCFVPKKDIGIELVKNNEDIAVRGDVLNPPPDKMIITHFNSSVSRGVESEKRLSITLGTAKKPKDIYKPDMLAQLSLYLPSYIDNAGLTKFAEKEGLSLKAYKNRLEIYSYPKVVNPVANVPDVLKPLYNFLCDEHQKRVTHSDTRQGMDRSKASDGKVRSAVIQLGVGDKESHGIVNLGADVVAGSAGTKKSRSRKHKIIPPHSKTISSLEDVKTWMAGGDVEVPVTGYNKDFAPTLVKALVNNDGKRITQDDILTNYGGKVKVDHSTGDKYDALIVGEINIRQKEIESRGIKIHRIGNQHKIFHEFSHIDGFEITNPIFTSEVGENAVKILQDAAEREGNMYSWRTASRNNSLPTKEEFTEVMDFMDKNDILRGTMWNIGINKKNNKNNKVILKG
ncbi:MAG: hypothetical protein KAJ93_08740 [Methanosarcinales archaeon]|nr:hypothetical protein [Methanosarcinales archaeon]